MAFPARTAPSPPAPYAPQAPSAPNAPAPQSPQAPEAPQAPYFSRRDHVEALLRARRLDRTLTTAIPGTADHEGAGFGIATLDSQLGGGLPRGQVSELTGPQSSGRTSLAWTWLGAATRRGEAVALIDTFDRFDPLTATRCGLALSRVLWVRGQAVTKTAGALDPAWLPGARAVEGPGTLLERTIDRALKALNLVLQSGVCTAVVLDMADVPLAGIRRVPPTTWMRLQRIVEGSETACLLMGPVALARSAGGVSLTTGAAIEADGPHAGSGAHRWQGQHDRARRLAGLTVAVRMGSPRWSKTGAASLVTITRDDVRAVE